jgi:hypothetical protein
VSGSVYRQAIDAWGVPAQAGMVAEECGELVAALNQFLRGRVSGVSVLREVADVQIMLRQVVEIVADVTGESSMTVESALEIAKEAKLSRLREMLDMAARRQVKQ